MRKTATKKNSPKNFLIEHGLDVLLVFVPIAAILHYSHASEFLVFAASGVAIIPLAGWMGKATEALAERLGAGIGGLLNATLWTSAGVSGIFCPLKFWTVEADLGV